MSAGAALIDACAEYPHERHFLAYPILFNYRHGLELAKKWIIVQYGGDSLSEIKGHNLWQLWKRCREIIETTNDGEDLEVVEKIIQQFHQTDPDSEAFRYWRSMRGTLFQLPEGPIDLDNIRLVMERVDHFLEGADCALSA